MILPQHYYATKQCNANPAPYRNNIESSSAARTFVSFLRHHMTYPTQAQHEPFPAISILHFQKPLFRYSSLHCTTGPPRTRVSDSENLSVWLRKQSTGPSITAFLRRKPSINWHMSTTAKENQSPLHISYVFLSSFLPL